MEKFARFMELLWLGLAFLSAGWAVYVLATQDWERAVIWVWFPVVCLAMWLYRRFTRRKMAEWAERERQARERA